MLIEWRFWKIVCTFLWTELCVTGDSTEFSFLGPLLSCPKTVRGLKMCVDGPHEVSELLGGDSREETKL